MKKHISATLLLTTFVSLPTLAMDEWQNQFNIYVANKNVEKSDWAGNDKLDAFALQFDIKRTNWPVSIAIDLVAAGTEKTHGNLKESVSGGLHIGLRKRFSYLNDSLTPIIAGGINFSAAEQTQTNNVKQDDSAVGYWLSIGLAYNLTQNFSIGYEARYSRADVTLFDKDVEAGGTYSGMTFNYAF